MRASPLPSRAPATEDRPPFPSPSRAAGREGLLDAFFSAKTLLGALLAYYIALRIGLERPYWSVTTCYIVAQPLAGALLSKALFRLIGTVAGAAMAVLLVPTLVNAPELLVLALALWLGLCTYLATLDRTPRAYVALLAGYSACIIGFPAVGAPGTIFDVASVRVQEIVIGIASVSLVHALLFPLSVAARLRERLDGILVDAETWSSDALATPAQPDATLRRDRRRLAADLHDLHLLSTHLPYDVSAATVRPAILRAAEERLALLLPLASAVEERMAALKRLDHYPPDVAALVDDVRCWLALEEAGGAAPLIARARSLEPALDRAVGWPTLLRLSLLDRMADLLEAHAAARALRNLLARGPSAATPETELLVGSAQKRPLHRDHGAALRAAVATTATVLIGCAFWITSAWPDGGGAVVSASIICALFSHLDAPAMAARRVFIGTLGAAAAAAFCAYVLLPRATDFMTLSLAIAPPLLVMGLLMAKPRRVPFGVGAVLAFPGLVGLNQQYADSFGAFANNAIAQSLGALLACLVLGGVRAVAAERASRRIARAGWRDLVRKTRVEGELDTTGWISRMLDRLSLIGPYLSTIEIGGGRHGHDILADLRTGIALDDLRRLDVTLDPRQKRQRALVLERLRRRYERARKTGVLEPDPVLARALDRAIARTDAAPATRAKRGLLLALVGLRCNLAPLP